MNTKEAGLESRNTVRGGEIDGHAWKGWKTNAVVSSRNLFVAMGEADLNRNFAKGLSQITLANHPSRVVELDVEALYQGG